MPRAEERGLSPVRPSVVQIGLFLATILSTLFVGALHEGADPFSRPGSLVRGIPFAVTLLSILFVHEMGHYITARRSGVEVTLPYFIPAPTLLGTFGAFIRMRPPIRDRGSLLMIGAAGPIAGFLVALPAVWTGVATSHLAAVPDTSIQLGDSLVMRAAVWLIHGPIPAGQDKVYLEATVSPDGEPAEGDVKVIGEAGETRSEFVLKVKISRR